MIGERSSEVTEYFFTIDLTNYVHHHHQHVPLLLTDGSASFEDRVRTGKSGSKTRRYYIDLFKKRNPYKNILDKINLDDHDINEERGRFGIWWLGTKLLNWDLNIPSMFCNDGVANALLTELTTEARAARIFTDNNPRQQAENENAIRLARDILDALYHEAVLPFRRERRSGDGAHARGKGRRSMSPPTVMDKAHITSELERINLRRNWHFEETLCQQGNDDLKIPKRRIVHLFCATSEDGVLERVCPPACVQELY